MILEMEWDKRDIKMTLPCHSYSPENISQTKRFAEKLSIHSDHGYSWDQLEAFRT